MLYEFPDNCIFRYTWFVAYSPNFFWKNKLKENDNVNVAEILTYAESERRLCKDLIVPLCSLPVSMKLFQR